MFESKTLYLIFNGLGSKSFLSLIGLYLYKAQHRWQNQLLPLPTGPLAILLDKFKRDRKYPFFR